MKELILGLGLVAVLGGLVLLQSLHGQYADRRNLVFFPDMTKSFAFQSQSGNPFFENRKTQQPPVEGTIARNTRPFHFDESVRDFVRAGRELKSPFNSEHPADLAIGRRIFEIHCQVCHGPDARGDGLVVQRGFPRPPSLLFGKALNMNDGHVFHIVTFGLRKMPAYGPQIEPEDRWQVIAYLRKLQGRQP